ncbi:MAG: VTT domain-containing protein [Candidatus Saccharimonadales bacterium]
MIRRVEPLLHFITSYGWLAVIIVIFAESGLMVGFFLPGDSLLFIAGTLVNQGLFDINIFPFILLLWIAAIVGNSTGYYIGQRFGRKLFRRPNSRFFRQEFLQQTEEFYEKYGSKTIIIAMFVPIVRAFAPVVVGIGKMSYRRFVLFNIAGALVWVSSFTLLGYAAGDLIQQLGINIEVAALVIIFLSLLPGIIHILSKPDNRTKIKHHVKHHAARIAHRLK